MVETKAESHSLQEEHMVAALGNNTARLLYFKKSQAQLEAVVVTSALDDM